MIKRFATGETVEFSVLPPLYRLFYNEWGRNAYSTYAPFSHDPFTLPEYKPAAFWGGLEYCTWVDQKHAAHMEDSTDVHTPLTIT